MKADLLIHSANHLVTCASPGGPKRGAMMADVDLRPDGAVAIHHGQIVAVDSTDVLKAKVKADTVIDAAGKAVCPGFVDCHTHTVYGGDRVHEFEMRVAGASYMEIMAAGGGIVSTMQHTRGATIDELVESGRKRLDQMLALGATTVEIKTGSIA